jgi:hypothetical protein
MTGCSLASGEIGGLIVETGAVLLGDTSLSMGPVPSADPVDS